MRKSFHFRPNTDRAAGYGGYGGYGAAVDAKRPARTRPVPLSRGPDAEFRMEAHAD